MLTILCRFSKTVRGSNTTMTRGFGKKSRKMYQGQETNLPSLCRLSTQEETRQRILPVSRCSSAPSRANCRTMMFRTTLKRTQMHFQGFFLSMQGSTVAFSMFKEWMRLLQFCTIASGSLAMRPRLAPSISSLTSFSVSAIWWVSSRTAFCGTWTKRETGSMENATECFKCSNSLTSQSIKSSRKRV